MLSLNRRQLTRGGAYVALATGLAACASDGAAFSGPVPSLKIDPTTLVHPELRGALPFIESIQVKEWNDDALRTARATEKPGPRLPGVSVEERRIPGRNGAPEVTVFIVNAKPGTSRPGILHMHGGGFITGRAAIDVPFLQGFVQTLDCTIVTVDYRRAPETTWSGSLEDNYAGLKWLYDNAAQLGVDPTKLAVMGGSAGGGHAALLAIAARDRGEVPLVFQSLTYPMLDDRTGSTRQMPDHIGTILWTAQGNRFGWRSFLGQEPGGRNVPIAAVPARITNLAGLPPAWIGVGTLDLFVDEDIEYARRLIRAGVLTELVVVPGGYHGMEAVPGANIAAKFNLERSNALRRAFGMKTL